jgi:spore coat polysaccharide biosynthesis protein SpsF
MSSSRLPGKVLRDLGGKPMLERVISRVSRARHINGLVVATTVDSTDDPIADFCAQHGTPVFRGSLYDVLDRYYQCARQYQADVIVRITADCPLIDPQEIDRVIAAYLEGDCDFAANRLPPPQKRTSPIGMDTEVCSFAALEQAWQNAAEKFEREHVMPYLYDTPGRFRVRVVETAPDMGNLRFTVDTEEDLQVARAIYAAFGNDDKFSLDEMLRLSAQNPQWQHSLVGVPHKSFLDVAERAAAQAQEPAPAPIAVAKDEPPISVDPKADSSTEISEPKAPRAAPCAAPDTRKYLKRSARLVSACLITTAKPAVLSFRTLPSAKPPIPPFTRRPTANFTRRPRKPTPKTCASKACARRIRCVFCVLAR